MLGCALDLNLVSRLFLARAADRLIVVLGEESSIATGAHLIFVERRGRRLTLVLGLRSFLLSRNGQQIKQFLVLLVRLQLFSELALLTNVRSFNLLQCADFGLQLLALLGDVPDCLFRLLLLLLKINLVLFVLVPVLLEGLHTIVQLFLLHHDVLLQQLSFFPFVGY